MIEMRDGYLQITYRHGEPLAAYLYLPRCAEDRVARSEPREAGLVVDYAADGRPIGIEITSPSVVTVEGLNRLLTELKLEPITADDLRPLARAG